MMVRLISTNSYKPKDSPTTLAYLLNNKTTLQQNTNPKQALLKQQDNQRPNMSLKVPSYSLLMFYISSMCLNIHACSQFIYPNNYNNYIYIY